MPITKTVNNNWFYFVGKDTCSVDSWIFDSGVTDHMNFEATDLSEFTKARRNFIANANGGLSQVTGAGTVNISPSVKLSNTLLVPSLSHKLIPISKITKDMNCFATIYLGFWFIQEIHSKEIIGRGTKREGLYYVDDLKAGRGNLAHRSAEQQIWLWHRRLDTHLYHICSSYSLHCFIILT